jgi:protein-arginine kinase activator protein McsA
MPLIQRLHGNELHCGKFPGENLPQPRLQSQMIPMREMLEKAIREGNKNLLKGGESDA